ncbi:hypothetical protein BTA35_0212140 [Oceanospirillum linum]|uniref:ABC transporter substrate-binding protein n=1 Tax=Oceanospirillum linum TaxID=966 RepID=A0A1T1HA01_OCELI|nr:hypothetical protein [Oceanospirillum linum]OOV86635.1 hypothetical protein BTA35_0212140 [Oceanospirillum linum]SEG27688.1 hypothetical protein SAMN04489856_107110 [Oleiphilus messinensis]
MPGTLKKISLSSDKNTFFHRRMQSLLPTLLVLVLVLGTLLLVLSRTVAAAPDSSSGDESEPESLATVLPAAHLLSKSLLAGTGVRVDYLPAKRYPVSRIRYWIDKKLSEALPGLPSYRAVVETASIWPEGSVYANLRQRNIAVIPVDMAIQLKPDGARISRAAGDSALDFFWLNPANLKVMVSILSEDFSRIWPEHQPLIHQNQQRALEQITGFALKLDDMLWQQGWDGVCSDDSALYPMLQSLSLPMLAEDKTDDLDGFRCLWIEEGKKASAEPNLWVVNGLNRFESGSLADWLEVNLNKLQQVQ